MPIILHEIDRQNLIKAIHNAYFDAHHYCNSIPQFDELKKNEFGRVLRTCILFQLKNYFLSNTELNSQQNYHFDSFQLSSGDAFIYTKLENSYNPQYNDENMLFPLEEIPRSITKRYIQLCVKGKKELEEVYLLLRTNEQILLYNNSDNDYAKIINEAITPNKTIPTRPSIKFEYNNSNINIKKLER